MNSFWIYNGYQWIKAYSENADIYAEGYYYIVPDSSVNNALGGDHLPGFQLPPDYKAPPLYDKNGKKIEYGKNGCPKGRDLSTFKCPCHFPKCVDLSKIE